MPDFKGLVKKAFPWINAAAALGGPLGVMAANAVGKAVGVTNVEASPAGLAAAIAGATPEQLLQLKQAEADTQARLQQMGFSHVEELERLAVEDRESARNLQVATKSWIVPALALAAVISFSIAVFAVLRGWARVEAAFAGALVGYLAANCQTVFSYYFGSSSGSDRKTELLANSSGGSK
jgi:hypothetical protein